MPLQECQARAWKSYHKYECSVMKQVAANKNMMGALPQALARLLLWIKKQTLSEDDFKALVSLEHHYDTRSDRWLEILAKDEDAVMEPTLHTAYQVKQIIDSKLGLAQVQKLLLIVRFRWGWRSNTAHEQATNMYRHSCTTMEVPSALLRSSTSTVRSWTWSWPQ